MTPLATPGRFAEIVHPEIAGAVWSVSAQSKEGAFRFVAHVANAAQFAETVAPLTAGDLWSSVNPVRRGTMKRGGSSDIAALVAVHVDVDVKPGAFPDIATAAAYIDRLAAVLNTPPTVVVATGGGLQPRWMLDKPLMFETPADAEHGRALLKRFGRLAAKVADGVAIDNVFDLPRVLRVPGSRNSKYGDHGTAVTAHAVNIDADRLTVDGLEDALQAHGIELREEGRDAAFDAEPVSAPDGWEFAPEPFGTDPYVLAMVAGWATDAPSARHPWLLAQCVRIACAHRLGAITATDHAAALAALEKRLAELRALPPLRPQPGEFVKAVRDGIGIASRHSTAEARSEIGRTDDGTPESTGDLFDERDVLRWVRDYARSRRVAPSAALGVLLVRTAGEIMPHIQLPPLVGSNGSLNLFAGLVAGSGGGKTAAVAAIDAAHPWVATTRQPGSGEGLVKAFVDSQPEKDERGRIIGYRQVQHTASVVLVADEVDTLTAVGERRNSTLFGQLRTLWSGGSTGFAWADPTKASQLQAHTYRLGLIVGIQPRRAAPLLDQADAGTPQRFLWCSATDPDAPDDTPADPGPMPWAVPDEARQRRGPHAATVLDIAPEIREAIDATRRDSLRGVSDDPEAGHRNLNRLKVAAILGLLDGRLNVTADDWRIAGRILEQSDRVRQRIAADLAEAADRQATRSAERAADRALVIEARTATAGAERVALRIARHVHSHAGDTGCTRKCVRGSLASRDREHYETAVAAAVDRRWVAAAEREDHARPGGAVETFTAGEVTP